jgi:hypothetical protein
MPTIQGSGGSVVLPGGFNAKLNNWTAQLIIETVDTTGFEDLGYRTREPVLVTLIGTASGAARFNIENATPASATLLGESAGLGGAKGDVTLQAAPGCTYSFAAVMHRITLTRPVDGRCDVTFDFQATGHITQTWDQGEA